MHLPESLVDAYAAGTLTQTERLAVEAHTLVCDDCLREVTIASLSMRVQGNIRALLFGMDSERNSTVH